MNELQKRLVELADFLEQDPWTIPVTAVEDCRAAAKALGKMSHRRCRECGHEAYYTDSIVPECCCERCGSADTRLVR